MRTTIVVLLLTTLYCSNSWMMFKILMTAIKRMSAIYSSKKLNNHVNSILIIKIFSILNITKLGYNNILLDLSLYFQKWTKDCALRNLRAAVHVVLLYYTFVFIWIHLVSNITVKWECIWHHYFTYKTKRYFFLT